MVSNPHSDFTTHSAPCQPSATCQFSPQVWYQQDDPDAVLVAKFLHPSGYQLLHIVKYHHSDIFVSAILH